MKDCPSSSKIRQRRADYQKAVSRLLIHAYEARMGSRGGSTYCNGLRGVVDDRGKAAKVADREAIVNHGDDELKDATQSCQWSFSV